jgi:hypothetical protein
MSTVEESRPFLLGLKPSMPKLALALAIDDLLDLYHEGEINTILDPV